MPAWTALCSRKKHAHVCVKVDVGWITTNRVYFRLTETLIMKSPDVYSSVQAN